jgi:hypothetical protein
MKIKGNKHPVDNYVNNLWITLKGISLWITFKALSNENHSQLTINIKQESISNENHSHYPGAWGVSPPRTKRETPLKFLSFFGICTHYVTFRTHSADKCIVCTYLRADKCSHMCC